MKIEQVDPASLVAADYNPRRIDEHQLEALKRSLDRWGFVQPVIINKKTGSIVGGHQRVTAALELAMEKVPVVRVDLDEPAEKALNIALNKVSGEWDNTKLSELLEGLQADGYDLLDLGFYDDELSQLGDECGDGQDLNELDEYTEDNDDKVLRLKVPMSEVETVRLAVEQMLSDAGWEYPLEVI